MDQGPQNAVYNLKDAAKAILNWEKIGKVKLTVARRRQLEELRDLTPQKLEQES